MKTAIQIILYGLIAELLLTQGSILLAVKYPSTAAVLCAGFCILTVFTLTYLLIQNLSKLRFTHYHIAYPPLEKERPTPTVQTPQEPDTNLLLRPTFMR